jgi:trk system potassium uptake protein TrkA
LNIIILGAGNTGSYLAGILSAEEHNITVIDKNEDKLGNLLDKFDLSVYKGNGTDFTVLKKAGLKSADMLIAVTDVDEVNIVSCFVAAKLGVRDKIARVRGLSYYDTGLISMEELGVDHMINPEEVAANDIYNLIHSPAAFEIAVFSQGKFMLKGYKIGKNSRLKGLTIRDIVKNYGMFASCTITMILRENEVIIPSGKDIILEGDKVYIVAETSLFPIIAPFFNENHQPIKKVFIVGANNTSAFFVEKLMSKKEKMDITLFDKDINDCVDFGKAYPDIKIVNANPTTDTDEMVKEGLSDADAFVATSLEQDVNILSALIAKKHSVRKTIVKAVRPDVFPFYNMTSIDAVISPEFSTTGSIMRFVRRGELSGVTPLANKRAEILEFKVTSKCKVINTPLKDLKLPPDSIIAYITRDDKIIMPKGETVLKVGDEIFLFSLSTSINKLIKIFG